MSATKTSETAARSIAAATGRGPATAAAPETAAARAAVRAFETRSLAAVETAIAGTAALKAATAAKGATANRGLTGRFQGLIARGKVPTRTAIVARRVEIRPAAAFAFHAQDPPGSRIGIEPLHAAVRGNPFKAVTRIPAGPIIGTLDIGKIAGPVAADAVKDLIERANLAVLDPFAGPVALRPCGLGRRDDA